MAEGPERWSATEVSQVVGVPWEPAPGKLENPLPLRVRFDVESGAPGDPVRGTEPQPVRRLARITRAEVLKYGYTLNCDGCKAIGVILWQEQCRKKK